jgi:hypothetical protein
MSKLHRILIAVLVAQLVLTVVVFLPRNTAATVGQPLLGVTAQEVTGLTVTDDQGAVVKLAKRGETWVLPDAGDYPADTAKVTPLLAKLTEVKTDRRVAQTAASHAQLQVADATFSRKVELTGASGTKTLLLGTSAGGQATHVRISGQDDVYIATGLSPWEVSSGVSSWISTSYLNIPIADITGFKLGNAAGEWVFEKSADGVWTQTGGSATDSSAVSGLVGQLASLNMTQPVGKVAADPQYGLTQPLAQAELTYGSGEQQKKTTIRIGTKDAGDNSYAAISSESEYVVRVAEFSVKDAVERATFAPAIPTPAATTGTPTP